MSAAHSDLPPPAPSLRSPSTASEARGAFLRLRERAGNRALWALGGLFAIVVAGYDGARRLGAGTESTDNALVDGAIIPIVALVEAPVAAVRAADNAVVQKGEVLLELDAQEARARLAQAEGELAAAEARATSADAEFEVLKAGAQGGLSKARAQLSTTQAQVGFADAQIAVTEAKLSQAQAQARFAVTELERATELHAKGLLSAQDLNAAQVATDVAQAAFSTARAQLVASRSARLEAWGRVHEASEGIAESLPVDAKVAAAESAARFAQAKVTSARATRDLARLAVGYTRVVAPADGTVAKLRLSPGQVVTARQAVAELVPQALYVVANFKETQVANMRPGQAATVEVDAYPGVKVSGRVESISPATGARFSLLAPDNSLGNYVKVIQRVPVKITWDALPAGVTLRPGMTAEVSVKVR